jgi:hypothetical protein
LTIAREAEKQRRRQLEESWNQITRRTLPPTFEKAAGEWLKGREGRVAPSTLRIGKMAIAHLAPAFGDKLLCDIAPRNIGAYQQGRLTQLPRSAANFSSSSWTSPLFPATFR